MSSYLLRTSIHNVLLFTAYVVLIFTSNNQCALNKISDYGVTPDIEWNLTLIKELAVFTLRLHAMQCTVLGRPFFSDQYAFRPTVSTTAALIAILHTVCSMLSTSPYVRVFAFDFTKAFDTVRHALSSKKCLH